MNDLEHERGKLLGIIEALPIISREVLRAETYPKVPRRRAITIRRTAEKVVLAAIELTRVNGKNFAELTSRAEINKKPEGLRADHSWKQGFDAFGTDTF